MDNIMILLMCSTCSCVLCIVFFVVRVNRNLANCSLPLVVNSDSSIQSKDNNIEYEI